MQTAQTPYKACCERVVVTASNGRVYDLGKPDSPLFRVRVWVYKLKRRIYG